MTFVTRYQSNEFDGRIFRNATLDGAGKVYVDGVKAVYQNSRTVDDIPTLYKDRIPRGINCSTRMSGVRYDMSGQSDGLYESVVELYSQGKVTSTQCYKFFGNLSACPMPEPEADVSGYNRANNAALMDAFAQITDAQRSFQAFVAGGELGESLHMIRRPAQALRELVFDHRRRVKKHIDKNGRYGSRAVREAAAGMWLEASFGWRPLINDVHSGAVALAKVMNYTPDRVLFRAGGRDIKQSIGGTEFFREWGPLKLRFGPAVTTYTTSVRYYGAVGMPPSDISGFLRVLGVSWSDVAPALWELIPYSFLVDYFTNVGGIIDACSTGTSNVKWVNRGVERTASRKRSYILPSTFIYKAPSARTKYTTFQPGTPSVSTVRSISRDSVSELGLPSLEFRIPGMSTKWINIAALLSLQKNDNALYRRRG